MPMMVQAQTMTPTSRLKPSPGGCQPLSQKQRGVLQTADLTLRSLGIANAPSSAGKSPPASGDTDRCGYQILPRPIQVVPRSHSLRCRQGLQPQRARCRHWCHPHPANTHTSPRVQMHHAGTGAESHASASRAAKLRGGHPLRSAARLRRRPGHQGGQTAASGRA